MSVYDYVPSFGAAIVFLALFGLSSILHFVQLVRSRTWFFIPFIIGGLCKSSTNLDNSLHITRIIDAMLIQPIPVETVGYAAVSLYDPFKLHFG